MTGMVVGLEGRDCTRVGTGVEELVEVVEFAAGRHTEFESGFDSKNIG